MPYISASQRETIATSVDEELAAARNVSIISVGTLSVIMSAYIVNAMNTDGYIVFTVVYVCLSVRK